LIVLLIALTTYEMAFMLLMNISWSI